METFAMLPGGKFMSGECCIYYDFADPSNDGVAGEDH